MVESRSIMQQMAAMGIVTVKDDNDKEGKARLAHLDELCDRLKALRPLKDRAVIAAQHEKYGLRVIK